MSAEALGTVAALVQLMLLDHRAHGAVENDDPLLEQSLQPLDAFAARGLIRRNDAERRRGHARRAALVCTVGVQPYEVLPLRPCVTASAHATAPSHSGAAKVFLAARTPSAWQIAYVNSARFKV